MSLLESFAKRRASLDTTEKVDDAYSISVKQSGDLSKTKSIEESTTNSNGALRHAPTIQRRFTRASVRSSRLPPPPTSKFGQFYRKIKMLFGQLFNFMSMAAEGTGKYLKRLFTLPLVRGEPISYSLPEDFDEAGKPIYLDEHARMEYDQKMDLLEAACNYTEKTRAVFQKIITNRREFAENRQRYAKDIDWSKLSPWTDSYLGHLESTFKVFDTSDDALVDFDEVSSVLIDYGDKTDPEERAKVFAAADLSGKGALTFIEFITMIHSITVKSPDNYPSTIVDSFRSIERNMARIRGLDVVQQLQAGLF